MLNGFGNLSSMVTSLDEFQLTEMDAKKGVETASAEEVRTYRLQWQGGHGPEGRGQGVCVCTHEHGRSLSMVMG